MIPHFLPLGQEFIQNLPVCLGGAAYTARKYAQLQSYTMKKKIFPLEIATEDGEYIIPTEYYNNAIFKESEETA